MKKVVKIVMMLVAYIGIVIAFATLPSVIAEKWSYYSSKKNMEDQVLEDDIDE